jgi:cysteine desulfurase/selenocysteine lyase
MRSAVMNTTAMPSGAKNAEAVSATRMTAAQFRSHFPGTERSIYMDVAARGLPPIDARKALDRYLDERLMDGGDKQEMFLLIERLRAAFADFIGAGADEICYTKNVSEGLNAIIAAFDWQRGDRIVYCPELEHPNNVYPWRHLLRRTGVELIAVPALDGQIDTVRMVDAIDERTRMVTVSSVPFAPGLVTDLAPLGAACQQRGVFLLVDAVQSVGLIETDVRALGIDAFAISTQKGMLGLYGMGYLYCRREWADRLDPAYIARFSVDLGDAHEASLGDEDFKLMSGARRFEIGNYNFAAATAAEASLALLVQMSAAGVEAHVRSLASRLAAGLEALGLPLIGPPSGAARGSIVCIGALGGGGHDSVDDTRLQALYEHLSSNGVRLSIRRGLLRLSLHAYNDVAEVERVIDLARRTV